MDSTSQLSAWSVQPLPLMDIAVLVLMKVKRNWTGVLGIGSAKAELQFELQAASAKEGRIILISNRCLKKKTAKM